MHEGKNTGKKEIKKKTGQVAKIVANRYTVLSEGKRYNAYPRGKTKQEGGDILVGDIVEFTEEKPFSAIDAVLPRKNKLIRPYVSNVDIVMVVAAKEPEPDLELIDKILVNCYAESIEPVLCYNKCDLSEVGEAEAFFKPYKNFLKCFAVSAESGAGLMELKDYIKGKLAAFAGQSAAGKTSLLNAIMDLDLKTDVLSARIARGKNTTRHIEIFEKDGVRIIDTCGFSMLELQNMRPEELKYYYNEFLELPIKCRYHLCDHISEPDCAVRNAVERGDIDRGRYQRYNTIYQNLKEAWKTRYD